MLETIVVEHEFGQVLQELELGGKVELGELITAQIETLEHVERAQLDGIDAQVVVTEIEPTQTMPQHAQAFDEIGLAQQVTIAGVEVRAVVAFQVIANARNRPQIGFHLSHGCRCAATHATRCRRGRGRVGVASAVDLAHSQVTGHVHGTCAFSSDVDAIEARQANLYNFIVENLAF